MAQDDLYFTAATGKESAVVAVVFGKFGQTRVLPDRWVRFQCLQRRVLVAVGMYQKREILFQQGAAFICQRLCQLIQYGVAHHAPSCASSSSMRVAICSGSMR